MCDPCKLLYTVLNLTATTSDITTDILFMVSKSMFIVFIVAIIVLHDITSQTQPLKYIQTEITIRERV